MYIIFDSALHVPLPLEAAGTALTAVCLFLLT